MMYGRIPSLGENPVLDDVARVVGSIDDASRLVASQIPYENAPEPPPPDDPEQREPEKDEPALGMKVAMGSSDVDLEMPSARLDLNVTPGRWNPYQKARYADGGRVMLPMILKKLLGLEAKVGAAQTPQRMASGGRAAPRLVRGGGDGRSDSVPVTRGNMAGQAELSVDEFVFPADVVSAAGLGSTSAGARRLSDLSNQLRQEYREHLGQLAPPGQ